MKDNLENKDKQNEILKGCFDCLIENGLENTTTRIISKATGLTASSLYYWFEDKDSIVLDATRYGMEQIVESIFTTVYTYLSDVSNMLDEAVKKIREQRKELRFIYQVVTSPQYGERMREHVASIPVAIDSFANVLAEKLDCDYNELRTLVHLAISVILSDVIWEDTCVSDIQYEALKKMFKKVQE